MEMVSLEERIATATRMHKAVGPSAFAVSEILGGKILCLADVGCGDGIMSAMIVRDIQPDRAVLVDNENKLAITLGAQVWHKELDVCDEKFVRELKGKVHLMTSFFAFHEFKNPLAAVRHMMEALPAGAAFFLMDRSEAAWSGLKAIRRDRDDEVHYRKDLKNLARTGLGTDAGIRSFWQKKVPEATGRSVEYYDNGTMYSILYRSV
jgi:hypothetical protein